MAREELNKKFIVSQRYETPIFHPRCLRPDLGCGLTDHGGIFSGVIVAFFQTRITELPWGNTHPLTPPYPHRRNSGIFSPLSTGRCFVCDAPLLPVISSISVQVGSSPSVLCTILLHKAALHAWDFSFFRKEMCVRV